MIVKEKNEKNLKKMIFFKVAAIYELLNKTAVFSHSVNEL